MCGITFVFSEHVPETFVSSIPHRGPDSHCQLPTDVGLFAFDRLAVNDLTPGGNQPFDNGDGVLICNGEIYNHRELERQFDLPVRSGSDCECLLWLLCQQDLDSDAVFRTIDAEFACVFYNRTKGEVIAARDPLGVRPLYVAYDSGGQVVGFSSEAKGLASLPRAVRFKQFPPGKYWSSTENAFKRYHKLTLPKHGDTRPMYTFETNVNAIRSYLIEAVEKRAVSSDRPVAYFLSGGLDSSVIAAVGASLSKEPITTYSIGIRGADSPDLAHARIMADHIGANHKEILIDPNEALGYVRRVICKLETYDCTTVRASVPMFILSEYIAHHSPHRVMLSGEGADELFGGYLYFHHAPTDEAFHNETIRLLKNIHQFDGLRADRCTASHGLELRVPFLDHLLVEYVTTTICPSMKQPAKHGGVEKKLLREAFKHLLPESIVTRQKNGMSDAVGYLWVDFLRQAAAPTDHEKVYEESPPLTPEERWYREIFHEYYDDWDCSHQSIWRPRWTEETDPSARKLSVFSEN